PIEMRIGWREVWDPAEVPVIDIAHASNSHYMHRSGVSFVAAVAPTLEALSDGVKARKTWSGDEVGALQAALGRAFPRDDVWGPAAIVDECRKTLPPETVATVDSGAHRILLSQMWSCPGPRTLLQSSGLCTMGCAVPLAIGAAHVRPDRPTVSFSGDAGFLMVAGELGTARELGTRAIFVVFADASLALIEKKQRQRQMVNAGVDFGRHDFAAIGRAFGGQGFTVTDRAELRIALQSALRADTFSVIGAMIDRQAYDGRI
ncbi:MAG: thiamine pyrophosphate-dependent enzyme, partial [Pseudomonadota bacterium]